MSMLLLLLLLSPDRNINLLSNTLVPNNVASTNKTQLTTKSEVSQSTAISDRPKAKAKNSRKNHQQQQQQQQAVSDCYKAFFAQMIPNSFPFSPVAAAKNCKSHYRYEERAR
jgi:hypothetical protein